MPQVFFKTEKCKGCGLCLEVCPVKIIKLSGNINKLGYQTATVHEQDKCTGCTMCALICPDAVISIYK